MTSHDPIEQLPRGIALAWGVAATPQRGPKREMSVEKIVEAAIEIADQEGIQAVSMSAVAKRLGYTPMSLYRYVSAKDDLLLLMQEEAVGLPPEAAEDSADWRSRLRELYEAQTMIYGRQPWLLALPISGSPITPNSSAWLDASLEALSGTPLTQGERLAVALFVTGMARWQGTVLAGYREQSRSSGLSDAEIARREFMLYDAVISVDNFPSLRQAIDAGVFTSEADPFAFGLELGLDGLFAYIDRVGAQRDRSPIEGEGAGEGAVSGTSGVGESDRVGPIGVDGEAERCAPSDLSDDDPEVLADRKYREAQKAVRQAQKVLAEARRRERQVLREAKEQVAKRR